VFGDLHRIPASRCSNSCSHTRPSSKLLGSSTQIAHSNYNSSVTYICAEEIQHRLQYQHLAPPWSLPVSGVTLLGYSSRWKWTLWREAFGIPRSTGAYLLLHASSILKLTAKSVCNLVQFSARLRSSRSRLQVFQENSTRANRIGLRLRHHYRNLA
jgi:hypothetical protein